VLRESGRANTAGVARHRARRLLVGAEVALAVVLAVGAGLMLRSFARLLAIDPGFRADRVLTLRLATPAAYYPEDADVGRFYGDVLARVRALPGVQSAGLIRVLPIDQEIGDSCVMVEGYTPPPGECTPADWQAASDGYFETLGLRLVEGRFIEAGDTRDAPQVMVVNQEFVRRYIADGNAIGTRVRFAFQDSAPDQRIVGVVGDARHNGITGEIKATFYRPHAQWARSTGFPQRSMSLLVRTASDPTEMAAAVTGQIRAIDARLPISSVQTMESVLSRAVAQPRFTLVLLVGFGALALTLAVIGIYGVVSYAVAARRQELGIRMALGAEPRAVVWLSLRHGLAFAAAGVVAGTLGALLATRFMRSILYDVATTDVATYVVVGALGLGAAFCASFVPALRAAKADPLTALRAE
jgi:predicted permease